MEPFNYYFDQSGKTVLTLVPTADFFRYLTQIEEDISDVEDDDTNSAYIFHQLIGNDELINFLEANYFPILENELHNWGVAFEDWPDEISLEQFLTWFKVDIFPLCFELSMTSNN